MIKFLAQQVRALSMRDWVGYAWLGAKKFSGPAGAAFVARGGQLALAIVLARSLGPESYGFYIAAVGGATLAAMFADVGWPQVVNRRLPMLIKNEQWHLLRGLSRSSLLAVTAIAAFIAALQLAAGQLLPRYEAGLQLSAALTVPLALLYLVQQMLWGVNRPTLSLLMDQGMASALVLLVVLLVPLDLVEVIYCLIGTMSGLVILSTFVFRRGLPAAVWSATPRYQFWEWFVSGLGQFASQLPRILVTRLDVLMVAPLAGLGEAGIFGVAFRLTLLVTFPQFILLAIITPMFSKAFAHGDQRQVRQLVAGSMGFTILTTAPFLLPVMLEPEAIMHFLFGNEFVGGADALVWLFIGQCLGAFGVPLNTMIGMGGNVRDMGRQGAVILLATAVIGYFLVSEMGALGGAYTLTISNVAWLAGLVWLAYPLCFKTSKSTVEKG